MSNGKGRHFLPTGKKIEKPPPLAKGQYVVPLGDVRFVLRALFFDPIAKSHQPLPLHQWVLFNPAQATSQKIFGVASQVDGVSWIPFEEDDPALGRRLTDQPDTVWSLGWIPLRKDAAGKPERVPGINKSLDVWYDLDKKDWVGPDEVGVLERRKLVRLPLWASHGKVRVGGFVDGRPGTSFAKDGLLHSGTADLDPYGEPETPWLFHVDHEFHRAYVRFFFYDLKAKARRSVPPGLVVQAFGKRRIDRNQDDRIAGGTAIDGDGTIYVLVERTAKQLADVHYQFSTADASTGGRGVVDLAKATPAPGAADERLGLRPDPVPGRRDERWLAPAAWHTLGMQAWLEEDGHGFPQRKPFPDLRAQETTPAKPLRFHLDDAILTADLINPYDPPPPAPGKKRAPLQLTLFDYLLHIRDPDGKRPQFWKTRLKANYLPAEDAVYVDGQGLERVTRLVYHDGVFFDLREKRFLGKIGEIAGVGARAAIAHDVDEEHRVADYDDGNPSQPAHFRPLPKGTGRGEYHLVDASQISYKWGALDTQLVHLLVYLPVRIEDKGVGAAAAEKFYKTLLAAGDWLDTDHPGHPGGPSSYKNYALTPEGGAQAGSKVVKVRHFFGPTSSGDPRAFAIHLNKPGNARGNTDFLHRVVELFGNDVELSSGGTPEPGQAASQSRFVPPHELTHGLGYPDEYPETGPPVSARWWNAYPVEGEATRPFNEDAASLMKGGSAPRLRHWWVYGERILREPDFHAMVGSAPVHPERQGFPFGLVHRLPFVPDAILTRVHPSSVKGPLSGIQSFFPDPATKRCDAVLYRLGDDEGTTWQMFPNPSGAVNPLPPSERYHGMVPIRIQFMVDFETKLDTPLFRGSTFSQIRSLFYKASGAFALLLRIEAPPAAAPDQPPYLHRIGVFFHPEFDFASRWAAMTPPRTPPSGHISLRLVETRSGAHELTKDAPPTPLTMQFGDIDETLIRYALGLKTWSDDGRGGRALNPLFAASDFQPLADRIGNILGDPAGTKRSVHIVT